MRINNLARKLIANAQFSLVSLVLALVSHAGYANTKLNVYAASSLTNVVPTLFADFKLRYLNEPQMTLVPVFAGSSALARQVANGAPADIVILANDKWMDYLVTQDWVSDDAVQNLTSNQLVVVAPIAEHPQEQKKALDLTSTSDWLARLDGFRLAMGNPTSVPAGIYAAQALEKAGVWSALRPMTAPTNNVRVALTLVERGEAPLGIVYGTDAKHSAHVEVVAAIPMSWHQPIEYPMALLSDKPEAMAFYRYLQSDAAQQILQAHGFSTNNNIAEPDSVSQGVTH